MAALGKFPLERLAEHAPKPGYDRSVLENIYRVVERFALHTGQIIFATDELTHKGLGDMTRSSKPKASQKVSKFQGFKVRAKASFRSPAQLRPAGLYVEPFAGV